MIEILISSTALILIIYGIRTFWKGKINAHLQYALWLLVAIRLLPFGLFTEVNLLTVESPISIMRSVNHLYTNLSNSDTNVVTQSNNQVNEATNLNKSDKTSTNENHSNSVITNSTLQQDNGISNTLNLTLITTNDSSITRRNDY